MNPWPPACKAGDLPLIYRPNLSDKISVGELIAVNIFFDRRMFLVFGPPGFNFVGGDPSAGSPTDTLLRLNPAY